MTKQAKQPAALADLKTKLKKLEVQLARALADYQNLEKRFERDSANVIKFGQSALLIRLISFRDHLELVSRNLSDSSLTMLLNELDKILLEQGVQTIDTTKEFEPSSMECIELVPGKKNHIIEVVNPGYQLHERILRPAQVKLGNGVGATRESSANKSNNNK